MPYLIYLGHKNIISILIRWNLPLHQSAGNHAEGKRSISLEQALEAQAKALEEDPTVFDYDGVYDDIVKAREQPKLAVRASPALARRGWSFPTVSFPSRVAGEGPESSQIHPEPAGQGQGAGAREQHPL